MHTQIFSYLDDNKQQMFDLLNELVCIQSGSKNKPGVDRVCQRIKQEMESMGFSCWIQQEEQHGNHLIAKSPAPFSGKDQILITGHMDTVFPQDTEFNFYKQDEKYCYGPGVADMKGGLVVGIFAIKALCHLGLASKIPICFVFNSDEEIGSPSSRELILEQAKKSRAAFVLEAGGLAGQIVTGRKGNMSARLQIEGKAGHAAFAGTDKASAILELAHKTIAIERLNAPDLGISANVGTIKGGIGPNTIAQHAGAALDFRFLNDRDQGPLKAELEKIVAETMVKGTKSSLNIVSSRPAMAQTPENLELFNKIELLGKKLDIKVVSELRQGVSDANIIAQADIPVIDGLGPIGAKDHSEDEYIEKQSMFTRTLLFANILASI